MMQIQLNDQAVRRALTRLTHTTDNLSPALRAIGELLTESTKHRFETQTDTQGNRWAENKQSTLDRKGNKPPLTGETGTLMDTIHYELVGNDAVEIGSPQEYAAMQQFGGTKSEFPFLWGDIPARPFLGLSSDDENAVLDIIAQHLETALR